MFQLFGGAEPTKSSLSSSPILRNIAWSFVGLTVVLAGAVIYLALGRAIIEVDLGDVGRNINFKVNLAAANLGQDLPAGTVPATFVEVVDSLTESFQPAGGEAKTGKAGGPVVIHNETARDQPLVATTRLLTPDGKLFRIQSTVRVPAGGTVTVLAAADQEGAEYEIGPTRFTIPGLNSSLQSVIYATSSSQMVRGATEQKTVTAADLDAAKLTLQKKLLDKIKSDLGKQVGLSDLQDHNFIIVTTETQTSTKAGQRLASFDMTINMKVVAVNFDRTEVLQRIQETSGGIAIESFDRVQASLDNYNAAAKTAVLTGTGTGKTSISSSSSIFDPANFVGMEPTEVENFLRNYDGVEGVKVTLSPYWINRLPKIPARIQVIFK
jgi:hypothetical protein